MEIGHSAFGFANSCVDQLECAMSPTEQKSDTLPSSERAIPRTVIALGMVSLFMDISSEMIHSLLPTFLVTVLGVSALSVGIIEGIAEATASISKFFPAQSATGWANANLSSFSAMAWQP